MNPNQTFNTNAYTLHRLDNNEVERHFESGSIEPELELDYYDSRIQQLEATYLEQRANLEAQRDKLAAFEAENPAPVIEEDTVESES